WASQAQPSLRDFGVFGQALVSDQIDIHLRGAARRAPAPRGPRRMMNPLPQRLCSFLENVHPDIRRLLVGYSGGLDSHALLHGLAKQRQRWPDRTLEAWYVDHGLQAASAAWGEHCA
ncbi:ATP-binding protein, partial [Arthrospira platensis SPKY1]|nr:ATP-binding protein [Arthrospira platensis SPKY1]